MWGIFLNFLSFLCMAVAVSEDGLQRAVRGAGAGGGSEGQGGDRHGAGGRHAARGIRTQVPLRHRHGRRPQERYPSFPQLSSNPPKKKIRHQSITISFDSDGFPLQINRKQLEMTGGRADELECERVTQMLID